MAGLIGTNFGKSGLLPYWRSSYRSSNKEVIAVNNPSIYQTQSFLLCTYTDGCQVTRIVSSDLYNKKTTVVKLNEGDDGLEVYCKGSVIYIKKNAITSSYIATISLLGCANFGNTTISDMTYSEFNAITDKVRVDDSLYNFGCNTLDDLAAKLGL